MPCEPRSPVRANGMRWNRTRFHLIPFRSRLTRQPRRAPAAAVFADHQSTAFASRRQLALAPVGGLHRSDTDQGKGAARLGETVDLPQAWRRRGRRGLLEVGHGTVRGAVVGRAVDEAVLDRYHEIERRVARAAVAPAAPFAIEAGGWRRRLTQ